MEETNNFSLRLKIIVVGDPSSGKTSSIHQFCDGIFEDNYQPTIGVEFSSKFITVNTNEVELRLWDIAGQDHYAGMSRVYYNGALGGLVMCDVTNNTSIEGVKKWKANIDDRVLFNNEKIPVLLIGNKADLLKTDEEKDAAAAKLKEIANSNGFKGMLLVSAKTGFHVEETMENIAKLIIAQFGNVLEAEGNEDASSSIDLMYLPDVKQKRGCCN
ncbi:small GTPase Rab32, putative [Entamoeba histolytica HM-1:IMSS-B]|uniref:Small GTPase Rab32, putative n=2 Tax=Entamoeba TaxID=5758 RepID=M3TRC0_ENTH1|nr:small GTPase Rab32, putative [Entamoeba histolytica HM-1:IMSS-B]